MYAKLLIICSSIYMSHALSCYECRAGEFGCNNPQKYNLPLIPCGTYDSFGTFGPTAGNVEYGCVKLEAKDKYDNYSVARSCFETNTLNDLKKITDKLWQSSHREITIANEEKCFTDGCNNATCTKCPAEKSLSCYDCNSTYDEACLDPTDSNLVTSCFGKCLTIIVKSNSNKMESHVRRDCITFSHPPIDNCTKLAKDLFESSQYTLQNCTMCTEEKCNREKLEKNNSALKHPSLILFITAFTLSLTNRSIQK